jgi:hypothetical protein
VPVVSRLWGWFELLPFRRGVTLLAVLVVVPVLIVGGILAVRGGKSDLPRHRAAAATPSAHDHDSETVEGVQRASGEIIASRNVRSGPKPNSATSATPHASHSASPRPRRPRTTAPPTPSTKCPTELRKWPWMWDLCKHRRGGHGGR